MKKGDLIWFIALIFFGLLILTPFSQDLLAIHPYVGGFIKFASLSTMGELLAIRLKCSNWKFPKGAIWRAIVWGFIGILIVLIFQIFSTGVAASLKSKMLPGGSSKFAFAFFTSGIMNITFAPTMMAFHRFTDTYIDMRYEGIKNITLNSISSRIDWNGFVSFVVVKTIPLFWIPAHTITFLLPPEYRVLVAASLSIALGVILSFNKIGDSSQIFKI